MSVVLFVHPFPERVTPLVRELASSYEVVFTRCFEAAARVAAERQPDVIVASHLGSAGQSGVEACHTLARATGRHCLAVVLTPGGNCVQVLRNRRGADWVVGLSENNPAEVSAHVLVYRPRSQRAFGIRRYGLAFAA